MALKQIVRFNTDGMCPVFIDLDQVVSIAGVEITSPFKDTEKRMEVRFRSGKFIHLNKSFVNELVGWFAEWMDYKNAQLIPVESRGLKP
jgi:hypothetical protein